MQQQNPNIHNICPEDQKTLGPVSPVKNGIQTPSSSGRQSSEAGRRKQKNISRPAPLENSCQFWIPSKHRYCKLTKLDNSSFCGEHDLYDPVTGKAKRIPCPFKSNQMEFIAIEFTYSFIAPEELENHKRVCVNRPKPPPVFHSSDMNVKNISMKKVTSSTGLSAKEYFQKMEREEFLEFANKIRSWYEKIVSSQHMTFETSILSHKDMDERLAETNNGKHAAQQASILGNMERHKLLKSGKTFVEFGCGKGELTNYIHKSVGDAGRYALIDRSYHRLKFDKEFKTGPTWRHGEIDIKDLCLSKFLKAADTGRGIRHEAYDGRLTSHLKDFETPSDFYRPVIAVSKHLCGAATDLTLTCLFNFLKESPENQVESILIALCCHQVCNYESYVAIDYLREQGISAFEFGLLCCTSTWAVCGDRVDATNSTHWSGLSFEEREEIGRKCKRILDMGRVQALRSQGFDAQLFYYVDKSTSLENMAMIATRSG